MKTRIYDTVGLQIANVATCDFDTMIRHDNASLLRDFVGREPSPKLLNAISETVGSEIRYHSRPDQNALDLARQALHNLLEQDPAIAGNIDFVIFAGISSPRPVTTISALLADEFNLGQASCWDLKSGCSTGVLALMQAHSFLTHGAGGGVIICAETLSKFTDPNVLQMSATIGDGAVALHVTRSDSWRLRALVHGTDPTFSQAMAVKGQFPVDPDNYNRADYKFSFDSKPAGIKALSRRWIGSMIDLLDAAQLPPDAVTDYFAHQVDAKKNAAVATAAGIPCRAVAKSFTRYGNMGCPTIFVNYADWMAARPTPPASGDHLVFQAVGGGLSWAAICVDIV